MSIGLELKSAREAASLSVEQVAGKSKLRKSVVIAIENDDFSSCGGEVYARGHIRVLASLYRVDSTFLLEIFDQRFGIFETALDDLAHATSQNLERRSPITWKSLSVGAALLLFVVLFLSNQISSNQENQIAGAQESTVSTNKNPNSRVPSPSDSQSLPAVAFADEGVVVQLKVVKSYSWISVTAADGTSLFTGQIEKGEVREFKDLQVLRLVIGNAGAVSISVNGVDQGIAGDIGEVLRLEFTPDAVNTEG